MSQLTSVVEPYGEVNIFPEGSDQVRVKATILMKPEVEGAQTGLAIDGSKSMADMFGGQVAVSSLFGSQNNVVQPVARTIAEYLANFDSDGETSVIYWACGKFGGEIEVIGDMKASDVVKYEFTKPKEMGSGTKLLPAIQYFTEERFKNAPWGIYLFITDGLIEDIEEVRQYSKKLCEGIASGDRGFTKLVIIGLGNEFYYSNSKTSEKLAVDKVGTRFVELDDSPDWEKSPAWQALETLDDTNEDETNGNMEAPALDSIDIWDYKLAATMRTLEEIFAEAVNSNITVSPNAEIRDSYGNPVRPVDRDSYSDGLPALIEFTMPKTSKSFTLILPNGNEVIQHVSV